MTPTCHSHLRTPRRHVGLQRIHYLSPSAWDWAVQPSGAAATWLCLCASASLPGPHRLRLLAAGSELLPLRTTRVAPPSLPGWPPCPSSIPALHSPLARGVLASGLWLVSPSLLPGLNAPWPGRSSPLSRSTGCRCGVFWDDAKGPRPLSDPPRGLCHPGVLLEIRELRLPWQHRVS